MKRFNQRKTLRQFRRGFKKHWKGIMPIFDDPKEAYELFKTRYGGWYDLEVDAKPDYTLLGETAAVSFCGFRIFAENYREGKLVGIDFVKWEKSAKDARYVPIYIIPIVKTTDQMESPVDYHMTVGWEAFCGVMEDKKDAE